MSRPSKIPTTFTQFEDAVEWLDAWPHAIGACSLAFVAAWLSFHDLPHRGVAIVWWVVVMVGLGASVVAANDIVVAWKNGEGRWWKRGE